ncbi:hypothetical protein GF373_11385 [bacterium]|nr:hypothetical protein [bacterium]
MHDFFSLTDTRSGGCPRAGGSRTAWIRSATPGMEYAKTRPVLNPKKTFVPYKSAMSMGKYPRGRRSQQLQSPLFSLKKPEWKNIHPGYWCF